MTEPIRVRIVETPDQYRIVNAETGDDMEPEDHVGFSYADSAARHAAREGWEIAECPS
jgi:hypothetical protein